MPTDGKPATAESPSIVRTPRIAQLRGVSHFYPGSGNAALADINYELATGTLSVLIGANGSGKSTLLRILAGHVVPTQGQVEVFGQQLTDTRTRAEEHNFYSRIAFISQELAIDPEMTGRETLTLLATLHGVPRHQRAKRVTELSEAFGLHALLARLVQTYSGGQRRRLHVAAGLLTHPELLLLDEPTAGLDAEGSTLVWKELKQRTQRGQTVVLVTHDLLHTQEYADQVVLLHQGRCMACAAPESLTTELDTDVPAPPPREPALARVYRGLTGHEVESLLPGAGTGSGKGRGGGQWRR